MVCELYLNTVAGKTHTHTPFSLWMTLNLELSVDPMSRVRPPYSWQDHRINDVFFSGYHIRRLPCHLVPLLGVILCVVKN